MKKLSKVKIDDNSFELINDHRCPRQLYRTNNEDHYALALLDRPNRIIQFESEVLTEVLNDLGGGVRDVTLVEFKEPEFGTATEDGFEIRLYLVDDDVIVLNQNDDVRFYSSTNYKDYLADLVIEPVTELWGLPTVHPFNLLEMSRGLKKLLDPYVTGSNPAEVISRMFSDYKSFVNSRGGKINEETVTFVRGEFLNFTVFESDHRIRMEHVH